MVNHSEGTAFAQGRTKKKMKKNKNDTDPKNVKYDKEFYKDKDYFRCGKKGHPKVACTVKMVPADEEKSTKPASSTKLVSSKTLSKEVGKTLSLINNAFKTIGKALSQVHEEIGTLADDESFEEQSHAQISMVMCGKTSYSFATGKFSMKNHLLLDNQSLVHVFCNPQFVSNVRSAERQLKLTSNGGNLPISEVADFDGFNKEVWYLEDAITNILSLSLVKHEYSISYDGEDFIIHQAKHGYADMVFKPHPSGLHVYDPDDPWGHESYSFVKTVEENMAMFTKLQIVNAELACKLQAGMAYPSIPDLKWVVQSNQIMDCPVTAQDVNVALKIWGPSVALLKDITVGRTPPVQVQDIVEVPKEIRENHKRVTLTIEFFFVNRVPYFVTLSLWICFLSDAHDQPKNRYNLQSSEGYAQFLSPKGVSDCVHQSRW